MSLNTTYRHVSELESEPPNQALQSDAPASRGFPRLPAKDREALQ